jgi:hypothetical protein
MRAQADLEGKSLYAVCSRGSLGPDLFLTGLTASCLPQKLPQLGDVRRDPPRVITRFFSGDPAALVEFQGEVHFAFVEPATIKARGVSQSFATFLLCYVDGEAVEQKGDNCFSVARCHHGSAIHALSDNPRKA